MALREKLSGIHTSLASTYYNVNAIVQKTKENTSQEEILGWARATRGHVYTQLKALERYGHILKDWKFGSLIQSEPFPVLDDEKNQ